MKTLAIVAHPDLTSSRIHKTWTAALRHCPDVTVLDLGTKYPQYEVDILEDQGLLLSHDRYVLQFPMHWYAAPGVMKVWLDAVLQPGFAFGAGGDKLRGKEFVVATSAGSAADSYRAGAYHQFTVDELLRPLQQMVAYVGGIYLPPYCFHRAMLATDEELEVGTRRMIEHVLTPRDDPRGEHEAFLAASMDALFKRLEMAAAD